MSRTVGKVFKWAAAVYVVIVIATAIFVAISLNQPSEDANFAGVWLILVTLPLSQLVLPPLMESAIAELPWANFAITVGIGFLQAAAVWGLGALIQRKSANNAEGSSPPGHDPAIGPS